MKNRMVVLISFEIEAMAVNSSCLICMEMMCR